MTNDELRALCEHVVSRDKHNDAYIDLATVSPLAKACLSLLDEVGRLKQDYYGELQSRADTLKTTKTE